MAMRRHLSHREGDGIRTATIVNIIFITTTHHHTIK